MIKIHTKNTKLRGIEVTRRGAPMPLLLYSGSEDRPWVLLGPRDRIQKWPLHWF